MRSRIQTRRRSRIGARISSIIQTFTRASEAALDGVTYAANTPRFPSQSGIKGLLNEEATTQLIAYSRDYTNAWWTKGNSTITADAIAAPDGTMTADKLVETVAAGLHFVSRGVLTVGQPGAVSVFAKKGERDWLFIGLDGGASANCAWFNLNTGAKGTKGASVTSQEMVSLGGGWYWCWAAKTSFASSATALIGVSNADNVTSYTGDGASGIYLWDSQAELKAYATSTIPTAGATATRAAETTTVPTNGLLTPSSGSVIIKFLAAGDMLGATGAATHFFFDNVNTGTDQFNVSRLTSGEIRFSTRKASVSQLLGWTPTLTAGYHVLGVVWGAALKGLWLDGTKGASSTAASQVPAALGANLYLGSNLGPALHLNQPIAYAIFYDRTLSDAEMAAATAGNPPPDFTAHLRFAEGKLESLQGHPYQPAEVLSLFMDAR